MMKRSGLFLGMLLLTLGCGHSNAEENENARAVAPLPSLTGRVVDDADIISPDAEDTLTAELARLESDTTDQLVVVTVRSLGGEPIDKFGLRLGNGWGIGQAGKNNGVLLIVAPTERRVRIEVGKGLEHVLTNARCAEIIRADMIPAFRKGLMADGIRAGVSSIMHILDQASTRSALKKAA